MTRFNPFRVSVFIGMALAVTSLVLASTRTLAGQDTTSLSRSESTTLKAKIVAIDKTARMVTLRGPKGNDLILHADETIKRFDQLKVGDEVTAKYTESLAVSVRKPGAPEPPAVPKDPVVVPREGGPGGTVTHTQTVTVTVQAIDHTVPALTVKTADGHTLSFRVVDKNNITGLKVGDKVDVTYTEALLLAADPAR